MGLSRPPSLRVRRLPEPHGPWRSGPRGLLPVILALLVVASMVAVGASFAPGAFPISGASRAPTATGGGSAAVRAMQAAAHALESGRGPAGAAERWSCPSVAASSVQCSAPDAPLARADGSSTGWQQLSVGLGTQPVRGFLAYDAIDAYAFLFVPASSGSYSGTGGAAAFYTYSAGVWSSQNSTAAPLYCWDASLSYDSTDHELVYWVGTYCQQSGATWTYAGGKWTNATQSTSPPARYGVSMADDPGVSGVLWFGGNSGHGPTNDTWSFSNGTWTNRTSTAGKAPTAEWDGGMSYDTTASGVVLVSGSTAASWAVTYTAWIYNGTWHSFSAPPNPTTGVGGAGAAPALADDPADASLLLVPGWNGTHSDVAIVFHAGTWQWANHSGIVEGAYPAAAYDTADRAVLVVDGANAAGAYDVTWEYANGTWTNRTSPSAGLSARGDVGMTYDAADGYVLLFGGCACRANVGPTGSLSDTWKFSNGTWSPVVVNTTPPARSLEGLVYDAADGYVVMFGGYGAAGALNDTWEYTNGGWTLLTPTAAPPAVSTPAMTYDAADNEVVLLTGTFPAQTWTFHAGAWTNLSGAGHRQPDGPTTNPIAYDSTDGYVLLYGTLHLQTGVTAVVWPETWEFRGGNWTNGTTAAGTPPSVRSEATVADFPVGAFVLLYGGSPGYPAVQSPLNDTWAFSNGSWRHLNPPVSPGNRTDMFAAYDPTTKSVVAFGGWYGQFSPAPAACGIDLPCDDTWTWTGGGPSSPFVESFTARPSTVDVGGSTNFSVTVVGGMAPFAYAYSGLPSGCASVDASDLMCRPNATGTWSPTVRVSDAAGHNSSGTTTVRAVPPLVVTFFGANPSTVGVGERTLLSARTANGTLPVTYVYTGLPAGCTTQDVPTLPCTPAVAGNFSVTVTASDPSGVSANGRLAVTVGSTGGSGGPRISGYSIAPSTVVLGNSTRLSVNASGGVGPLSYAYGGLPPGCASANNTSISCSPTSAGTYLVTFSVSDTKGGLVSVSANLTVDPVGGGPSGGLAISGFGPTAGRITLGASVILSVVASGGAGPLSYRYPALPAGCASANTSALPCIPSTPGTYALYVVVSDTAGHSQGAVGALVVVTAVTPSPAVSAFFATRSNLTLGNSTTLVVEARGVLPFTFVYSGLPAGCATRNASVLNCTPTETGTFNVTVVAHDALGRTVSASTGFRVEPSGGPKGPTNPLNSAAEPTGAYLVAGAFAGALVALAAAELFFARRRRREQTAIVRELLELPEDEPTAGRGPP